MSNKAKTELELKRARLEQIKAQKSEKLATEKLIQKSKSSTTLDSSTLSHSISTNDVDPDKILFDLGIKSPATSLSQMTVSIISNNDQNEHTGSTKSLNQSRTHQVKLSAVALNAVEIPPKELVTYTKETQTPATDAHDDKDAKPVDYYVLTYDNNEEDETPLSSLDMSTSHNGNGVKLPSISQFGINFNQDSKSQSKTDEVLTKKIVELPEEEKTKIIQNDEFLRFITRNTRILEKALDQDDIFFDYAGNDKNKEHIEKGEVFKPNREFYDEKFKNRIVTWMDWSPHFPELLLASYEESPNDPDGICCVWNSKFKTTSPEYVFNCSSWVTSCCFAKFHPNLIIGGTYSGQIVMWDNRSHKRTPIQRSSLLATSHTHPVYCIQVVGSQNAHNLISISNDGKLCSWTLDNMNTPQETLELQCKQSKNVAVTTMAFRNGDVNNFVIGSEEGPIYSATRHGNKSGIIDTFEGHYGPVTGLSFNQAPGSIDFSHIFLTTSFDWSVKLWNVKEPGKPLYSFENNSDYVYDAQWSPVNPALFVTCDGTGRLDLWNLINDAEVPTATKILDGSLAINKIRWSPNGQQLVVGDDQGKISLFDINENYSQPRSDDWQRFVRVLQDLKQSTSELEENGLTMQPQQPLLNQSANTSLTNSQSPQANLSSSGGNVTSSVNNATSPNTSITLISSQANNSLIKTPFLPK